MLSFLRNLDGTSFWLGFLAGTLFWWLLSILRPAMRRLIEQTRANIGEARANLATSTEARLRNDTLQHVQKLHLASALFSLDEVAIPPVLQPGPGSVEPGVKPLPLDITDQVIPYLPDWPEMAAAYQAPYLTLAQLLEGGCNLLLLGRPGFGKTTALAALASSIARQDSGSATLDEMIPVYVHAADLTPRQTEPGDALETLIRAVNTYTSAITQARLPGTLREKASAGRLLILLDGLDELPRAGLPPVTAYLKSLLEQNPQIRMVAAAAPDYFDGLLELELFPVSLAAWNDGMRQELLKRWRAGWTRFIQPETTTPPVVDPALEDAWLASSPTPLTPLELTLKIWSVLAGDNLGPGATEALEAYARRTCAGAPFPKAAMEKLALQAIQAGKAVFTQKDVNDWSVDVDLSLFAEAGETPSKGETEPKTDPANPGEILASLPRSLPAMVEAGLLCTQVDGGHRFTHPVVMAYLAARAYANLAFREPLGNLEAWSTADLWAEHLAPRVDLSALVDAWLLKDQEPLHGSVLQAARWLRLAQTEPLWRGKLLRQLAALVQNEHLPVGLRARGVTALAATERGSVSVLLRQMLSSPQPLQRQLAALGCGMIQDTKAVEELAKLTYDTLPIVFRSACLALVAIGNQAALEKVAETLLHGNEEQRQAAAEALANHPEEGHPTLQEGATIDDLLVRKAVIAGLKRIRQPWAIQIIEKMRVEDQQWVVKNAASEAIEEMNQPLRQPPSKLTLLTETGWLIAFAGEKGIGVAPGKPALDLLLLALREGTEEQQLAALEWIKRTGESTGVLTTYHVFYKSQGEVREAAYDTLWHLAGAGIELPPPAQFGLGVSH